MTLIEPSRALWSSGGLVGNVPRAALDRSTGILAIEVVIERSNDGGHHVRMSVPTHLIRMRERLANPRTGGVKGLRVWIHQRGIARFRIAHPEIDTSDADATTIYWTCGTRREPFLR